MKLRPFGPARWAIAGTAIVVLVLMGLYGALLLESTRYNKLVARQDEILEVQKRHLTASGQRSGSSVPPPFSAEDRRVAGQLANAPDPLVRAKAAIVDGDPERARSALSKMEPVADEAFSYFTTLGDSYYFQGQYDEAAAWYERAFDLPVHDTNATARNVLAVALQQCRQGDIGAQIDRAIDLHLRRIGEQSPGSADWAASMNNLGIAWLDRPTGDKGENNDKAFEAFKAALTVYTRERFPAEWAMTQNNLGRAWRSKPTGDMAANIDKAFEALDAALSVYTRERFPTEWAEAQINLGIAWQNKPAGDKAENIDKAFDAFDAALAVYTRQQYPVEWATTQIALGNTWVEKPTGDKAENIRNAIEAFTAALSVYTREHFPVKWATTQISLGRCWVENPTGDKSENIDKAAKVLGDALAVYTLDRFPDEWAATQISLGNAWMERPAEDKADSIHNAIEAYSAALTVYTREHFPTEWAITQHNLGNAWVNMPTGDNGENIDRAIEAYSAVLTVCTRESFPVQWAETQDNLGKAWVNKRSGDKAENFAKAIEACTAALTVYTRERFPNDWARTQHNLGFALLNTPTGTKAENIDKAIEAYTATLPVYTRERFPLDWARTQYNLGNAWADKLTGDSGENIDKAIEAYTAALTVYTRERFPTQWAETHHNLGSVWEDKPMGNSRENLEQAVACYEQALTVLEERSFESEHAQAQAHLERAKKKLVEMGVELVGSPANRARADEGPNIRPGTKVHFATAAEGARLLSARDAFVRAMSPFDRAARLKTDQDVTEDEYLAFAGRQALDWTADERTGLQAILDAFRTKTAELDLHFPASIELVKTTGLEEADAAYCRESAIMIPTKKLGGNPAGLEHLLFHELFHIYRRNYPDNRKALYRIIGYEVCAPIELPEELRSRKITNPDAPPVDSVIRIRLDGRRVPVTPVLFSKTEHYDARAGGDFFKSVVFRLMALEETADGLKPSLSPDGKPRLLDPSDAADYLDQVGRNTGYIIHPEEILAENFALLVENKSQLASPRVVEQMRALMLVPLAADLNSASGNDAFYDIPLSELKITQGELPTSGHTILCWDVTAPSVVLDLPGEAYLHDLYPKPLEFAAHLYIRAEKGKDITGQLTLRHDYEKPMARLKFSVPASAAKQDAEQAFYKAKDSYCLDMMSHDVTGHAWFRHQADEAEAQLRKHDNAYSTREWREINTARHDDAYDLFSGGRAISENLQLDRPLNETSKGDPTVPISTLKGIDIAGINWKSLLKDAKPELDPLAKLIPADQHVIFFPSFAAALALSDEMNARAAEVMRVTSPPAEDTGVFQKYEQQLGIGMSMLGRLIGPGLIKSIAVTGSDPYFPTGTDVAVLFESEHPETLFAAIRSQIAMRAAKVADAQPQMGTQSGVKYEGFRSLDREICSYVARFGGVVVVTNSLAQLTQLASVAKGNMSIAALDEYKFFRNRYPLGDRAETALLFLSDATIRRWCSPQWRIASARRTFTAGVLAELTCQHAKELMARNVDSQRLYSDSPLVGAGELSLTSAGVFSSIQGGLKFLTPIIELPIEKVSPAEAEAYNRWRDQYQLNWRWAFDPIALRIGVSDKKLSGDLTVMPLIAGTDYRDYIVLSRGAEITAQSGDPHSSLASYTLAINKDSAPMKSAGDFVTELMHGVRIEPFSWLGATVSVYADDDPFWDKLRTMPQEERQTLLRRSPGTIPVALHADVSNGLKLAAFLTALRAFIEKAAPNRVTWEARTHREQAYVCVKANESALGGAADIDLALFYAPSPDGLTVTLNEELLKRAIDRRLDKDKRTAAEKASLPYLGKNLCLQADHKLFDLLHSKIYLISPRNTFYEPMYARSWSNLPILNEWKQLFPNEDPVVVHERLWHTKLVCPGGGKYVWNDEWKTMESTAYGHPGQPKDGPWASAAMLPFENANFGLTFEDNGLRAKMELTRDAKPPLADVKNTDDKNDKLDVPAR
jgi:tetratricopeptide (TPR) repeat protein